MKNIIKTIIIAAIAVTLAGCAENNKSELDVNEIISSVIEENSTSSTEETVTSSTENKPEEKPAESSSTSAVESKPAESSSAAASEPVATSSTTTTTTKPAEKPVVSSSTTTSTKPASKPVVSSSKPVESKPVASSAKPAESKPVHTHKYTAATCEKPATCSCGATKGNALGHNYTSATCEKPATCTRCGATKGTYANHNYKNGKCTICGKKDPDYVTPHNCNVDGHIWEDNGVETTTEPFEIKDTHTICANGYDYDLAYEYFGRTSDSLDFTPYFGTTAYSSGSTKVKTMGTRTTTKYYHKCTECGLNKVYNTEKTFTPGEKWEFVYPEKRGVFTVLWYDINNIPDKVLEAVRKDNIARIEFMASQGGSRYFYTGAFGGFRSDKVLESRDYIVETLKENVKDKNYLCYKDGIYD